MDPMNINQTNNEQQAKKAKIKKIALFSTIGALAVATISLSAVLIHKAVTGNYVISDNRNNYAIDAYRSIRTNKNYEYLHSAVLEDVEVQNMNAPVDLNAHSFLIGKVTNVPFLTSAGVKFEYDQTEISIEFSEISMNSISNTLSHTTTKSESFHWSQTENYDEEFKAHAEVGISKFKATTDYSIKHGLTTVQEGTLSSSYTASNEESYSSCEAFQKKQAYKIAMTTANGFEKGKYYRMTLQQSVSMYLTVYELPKTSTNAQPKYFYNINNFLDDPMDYRLVIEKSDDPSFREVDSPRFDSDIYDDCVYYVANNKMDYENPPTKEELVGSVFKHADSVEGDRFACGSTVIDKLQSIDDKHYVQSNTVTIRFDELFGPDYYEPTLAYIVNNGHKNLDLILDIKAKRTSEKDVPLSIAVARDVDYLTKILQENKEITSSEKKDVEYNYYLEMSGIELRNIASNLTLSFKIGDSENSGTWKITKLTLIAKVYK